MLTFLPDSKCLEASRGIEPLSIISLVDEEEGTLLKLSKKGDHLNSTIIAVGMGFIDVGVSRKNRDSHVAVFPKVLLHWHFPPQLSMTADFLRSAEFKRVYGTGDALKLF